MSSTIGLVGLTSIFMVAWYAITFIWTGIDLWRSNNLLYANDLLVEDMFRRGGKLLIWLTILYGMLDLTHIMMTSTP